MAWLDLAVNGEACASARGQHESATIPAQSQPPASLTSQHIVRQIRTCRARTRRRLLVSALAWSFFGTAQSQTVPPTAVLPQPTTLPLLIISGDIQHHNVANEAHFDAAMLAQLPTRTLHTHTVVTDGRHKFDGVLVRDLLDLVGARGQTARAIALNRYTVDIPRHDFYRFDVLLATHMDDQRLLPEDKGPLWIVYPRDDHRQLRDIRYDYRWVWQLERLIIQ